METREIAQFEVHCSTNCFLKSFPKALALRSRVFGCRTFRPLKDTESCGKLWHNDLLLSRSKYCVCFWFSMSKHIDVRLFYLHLLFWEEWPFVRGDVKAKCSPTMHLFSLSISVMTMTCAQKSNKKASLQSAICHFI